MTDKHYYTSVFVGLVVVDDDELGLVYLFVPHLWLSSLC